MSVLAIIAFHSGVSSVPGGYYGVDSFFVLSGFLITSLLVKEWGTSGTIRLRRFWAGRARRLLPALFVMVAFVGLVLAVWPQVLATPHVVGDAVAAVFYASNWYSIASSATYFTLSTQPSPLLHTWSLAIEEQFYLVWPLVVLAVLKLGTSRRRVARARSVPVVGGGELILQARDPVWTRRRRLHALFVVACLGSLASALTMAILAPNGYTTRAYYGTDTRAQALLVGAAIAIGLTLWREGSRRPWFVRTAAALGIAGMVGTGAMWATTPETSTFAFCGGFLVVSLAAGAVVLGVVVAPRSLAVRLLELPPLPQWGRISYGIYLWYWPILLIMSGSRLYWGVYELFLARVAVTVAIATLSYRFVEMPIRRGALRRWRSVVAAPVGAAVAVGAVFAASTLVPMGASVLEGAPAGGQGATTEAAALAAAKAAALAARNAADKAAATTAAISPLLPPVPSTVPTRRVKVLLVGDSLAGSLGVGLGRDAPAHGIDLVNEGIPACSLSMTGEIKVLFYTIPPGGPCGQSGSGSLFATWQHWVDQFNPDVVLYVGRGETYGQELDGQWQNLGDPAFDRYVASRFRQAVSILGSRGATVVLLTSPYYDAGLLSSGQPWPENVPVRVQIDNQTIRSVAESMTTAQTTATAAPRETASGKVRGAVAGGSGASGVGSVDVNNAARNHASGNKPARNSPARNAAGNATENAAGNKVYVYNLNQVVDPGGQYVASVDGVNIRCNDGVHFSPSGGMFIGEQLLPDLAALGQTHAAASPHGSWPGPLPPQTPSWYEKLPCP
jgi:peptidoglycan/LPS O-acetylase OafA/YrhL